MDINVNIKVQPMVRLFKCINWRKNVANDKMRLTDKEFDILIKMVDRQKSALKEISLLEDGHGKKMAFYTTLSAKLTHVKANGISSKRAEVNATMIKAFCGDKEIFQLDLLR